MNNPIPAITILFLSFCPWHITTAHDNYHSVGHATRTGAELVPGITELCYSVRASLRISDSSGSIKMDQKNSILLRDAIEFAIKPSLKTFEFPITKCTPEDYLKETMATLTFSAAVSELKNTDGLFQILSTANLAERFQPTKGEKSARAYLVAANNYTFSKKREELGYLAIDKLTKQSEGIAEFFVDSRK